MPKMLQLTNNSNYNNNFKYHPIKHWYLTYCVFFLFISTVAFAEGSKELNANGGTRAHLLSSANSNFSFPFPTNGLIKVYAKVGEVINVGSSSQGINSGSINLRAPDGSGYTSSNSTIIGRISNRDEELAGPLPNIGGYTPYTRTVQPGQEGIWEINFLSSNPNNNTNPPTISANDPWIQTLGNHVSAFDVSVRDVSKSSFLTGRVFTNIFCGIMGAFNVGFNGIFHIVTKDGYQYILDNNGQAGNGFSFFANNKGFRNLDGSPSYKSVNNTADPDVQDPNYDDTQSDVTHKLFFNTPATDMPVTAKMPGDKTTWLINPPFVPTVTNVGFTGTLGTPGKASTATIGGTINFTAATNGSYIITIDVNQNGVFTDAIDRKFTGTVNAGPNKIEWEGTDGLGNVVPLSASNYTVNINLSLYAAEVHFPFFDVERNFNGIKLTRINGFNSPDYTMYWDDSPITPIGTPSNPVTNLTGISSLTNGHVWGSPTALPGNETDFGNNKSIDTWAYVVGTPLIATINFKVLDPYVATDVVIPTIFTPNGDGKNDTFFITDLSFFPGSKLVIFNRWSNEVYHSEDYQNDWTGQGLTEGTYYFTLKRRDKTGKFIMHKGWVYLKR
jgi:gliding motility-associated-like protein